jgi:hypothetical protein
METSQPEDRALPENGQLIRALPGQIARGRSPGRVA